MEYHPAQEQYAGVPRSLIPWFPTIDVEKCQPEKCSQECIKACPRGIFEMRDDTRVVVVYPENCTVGDISCSFQCPLGAISFPKRAQLKTMVALAKNRMEHE